MRLIDQSKEGSTSIRGITVSDYFLGQIMLTGFGFAPRGFAQCNGQLLPTNQYSALFSLLGVQFGGNGSANFALPNLQGTTPLSYGSSRDPSWQPTPYPMGANGGVESVRLQQGNLPMHSHMGGATTAAASARNPVGAIYGAPSNAIFGPASSNLVPLATSDVSLTGGSQPHNNMQPFLAVNFNIALTGIYPSRT